MNAALQADLGRTPISGLRGAPPHLLEIEHIGWTAQVLRRPFRKGAEAAFVKADIGVIDIAVDDVGHRIANHLPPQFVGRTGDECNVGSVGFEQPDDVPLLKPSTRSDEHTSELQSLMRISYAVFCLKKKKENK